MARKTNPTAYGRRVDAKFEAAKGSAAKVTGLGLATMGFSTAGGMAGAPVTGGLSLGPAAWGVGLGGTIARAGRTMLHQAHSERVRGRAVQDLAARGKNFDAQKFERANQDYEHQHAISHAPETSGGTVTVHEHQRRAPVRKGE